jgi:beta-ribofuranosylaminobenzene 5'-phosphate synthase
MSQLLEEADRCGSVTVAASARLHLGFLDMNGGLGRRFGSLGLAIDRPVTRLSIRRAARLAATGPEAERALQHLDTLTRHLGLAPAYQLEIYEAIPAHAGLGSGTKLALAVGSALRRLEGLALNPSDDAVLLRRGARSGLGVGLFEQGGFIVDGGRGPHTASPPVIARLDFPKEWRVLLVTDPVGDGLHGEKEIGAFAALAPLEAAAAGEICRLVLIRILPALAERDFAGFGEAISRVQEIVGDYFAPVQGGAAYSNPRVGSVMNALKAAGATGTGQSSWGPTGFAFAPSLSEAQRLHDAVREKLAATGLDVMICKGLNHGAFVQGETLTAIK